MAPPAPLIPTPLLNSGYVTAAERIGGGLGACAQEILRFFTCSEVCFGGLGFFSCMHTCMLTFKLPSSFNLVVSDQKVRYVREPDLGEKSQFYTKFGFFLLVSNNI